MPIDEALPRLLDALRQSGMAVLQAPPGAGKTTGVPPALLDAGLCRGRILMLEPRRLAAVGAATRMAEMRGEAVGGTVGYRIRGEARVSAATRIEVVTDAILTRMIQTDPGLEGIGAVIFDEFHERSVHADLGLALCLEARAALREDLILLVMSATLDGGPMAALMGDAPLITSEGRAFAVETRWLERPLPTAMRFEAAMAAQILTALEAEREGGLLAFLPGEGEIRRVEAALSGHLPTDCVLRPLYGALGLAGQRAALAPLAHGRRVVLATSIAETSLTLPDIRVVVDGGRARRARFDAGSGMSRLVTERVSRAEADQRRGRAGRVGPGVCYRLWTRGEEGALPAFAPAEIEVADLAPLALELALWGGGDGLAFLTPPNPGALAESRALLAGLGALEDGRITRHGERLAALPLHPRLGHMLVRSGDPRAPTLAALLAEPDPMRGAAPDLALRMAAVEAPGLPAGSHATPVNRAGVDRIRAEAARLSRLVRRDGGRASGADGLSLGGLAALAYPDRVGLRRPGEAPRYLLSGGKGAVLPDGPLSGARIIVATDLDGDAREARIRQAVALTEPDLRAVHGTLIAWHEVCRWSRREGRVLARRQERFGAIVLDDRPWTDAPDGALARAALDGVRLLGLPWTPSASRFRARAMLCRRGGADLPDMADEALLVDADDWLLPWLTTLRTEADLRALDLTEALRARVGWEGAALIDRLAPAHVTTPLGRRVPVDYAGDGPGIEVRLQEMFGTTVHPVVGPDALPLRVTLLSPGGRPVQVTTDLPGFWASSYADVRRDLRGRYPRHAWPEDPARADPTARPRPRGT